VGNSWKYERAKDAIEKRLDEVKEVEQPFRPYSNPIK